MGKGAGSSYHDGWGEGQMKFVGEKIYLFFLVVIVTDCDSAHGPNLTFFTRKERLRGERVNELENVRGKFGCT